MAVTLMRALIKDPHRTALPSLRRAFSQSRRNVSEGQIRRIFAKWCKSHEKNYDSAEERQRRLQVFTKNYLSVREHNSQPWHTYKMGLNDFSDLTYEEFGDKYARPPDDVLEQLRIYKKRNGGCTCPRRGMAENSDVPDSCPRFEEKGGQASGGEEKGL